MHSGYHAALNVAGGEQKQFHCVRRHLEPVRQAKTEGAVQKDIRWHQRARPITMSYHAVPPRYRCLRRLHAGVSTYWCEPERNVEKVVGRYYIEQGGGYQLYRKGAGLRGRIASMPLSLKRVLDQSYEQKCLQTRCQPWRGTWRAARSGFLQVTSLTC